MPVSASAKPLVGDDSDGAKPWSHYMLDIYISKKGPPLGTLYTHELEELAREALKHRQGELRLLPCCICPLILRVVQMPSSIRSVAQAWGLRTLPIFSN